MSESVEQVMRRAGGIAARAGLVAACGRASVDAALRRNQIVAVGHGRYALADVEEAVREAHALGGLLCLASAALHRGWEVWRVPDRPQVLVPRGRRVPSTSQAEVHRGDVHPDDAWGSATGIDLTLTMCLRTLPEIDALAVADSALRHGVAPSTLRRVAAAARGPGAPRVRRLAALADADAANPFESATRAISLTVPGLNLVPQRRLETPGGTFRPDLRDERLRIVVECDSFAWHGDRAALRRDTHRYDWMVVAGWIVLRFAWEDVMSDPGFIRNVLLAAVARAESAA